MKNLKDVIVAQFDYCNDIIKDIMQNNASLEVINHAKKYAEVETPMTGETHCCHVRVCYGDIYVFAYFDEDTYNNANMISFNGKFCYDLDGLGQYGGEVISTNSIIDFFDKLEKLSDEEILECSYMESSDGDYSKYLPKKDYKPLGNLPYKVFKQFLTKEDLEHYDMVTGFIIHNNEFIWILSKEGADYIFSDQIYDEEKDVWSTEKIPFRYYSHYLLPPHVANNSNYVCYAWYDKHNSYISEYNDYLSALDWLVGKD